MSAHNFDGVGVCTSCHCCDDANCCPGAKLDCKFAHLHDPAALERWFTILAKTIAVDFDGTLHPYSAGWCGSKPADEEPIEGAQEFLSDLHGAGYRVVVFSTRADHDEGRTGIIEWLAKHGLDAFVSDVSHLKVAAIAYVDDRAVPFAGGRWGLLERADALAHIERLSSGRAHGAAK